MPSWKTGDDESNYYWQHNTLNTNEVRREGVIDSWRTGNGLFISQSNMNVDPSLIAQDKDYRHGPLRTAGGYAHVYRNTEVWRRYKDITIVHKFKATDFIYSLKMVTRGRFAQVAGDFYLYLVEPETQMPYPVFVDESVTTTSNHITWVDNVDDSKTEFTLGADFQDMSIRPGDRINFSGTGISELDGQDNLYCFEMSRVVNGDSVDINFVLRQDSSTGTLIDLGTSSNANGTISKQSPAHMATLGNFGIDGSIYEDIPGEALPSQQYGSGDVLGWNFYGRQIMEILQEQYWKIYQSNSASQNVGFTQPRLVPRQARWDDHVYLAFHFLNNPTYDAGETGAQMGVQVEYASKT